MGLVLSHITSHYDDSESQIKAFIHLDRILQTFARSVLEQGQNDEEFTWGHSCGAFFVAMRLAVPALSPHVSKLIS